MGMERLSLTSREISGKASFRKPAHLQYDVKIKTVEKLSDLVSSPKIYSLHVSANYPRNLSKSPLKSLCFC